LDLKNTWPYNMFYFPLVMKTHFCKCLSLSTNNMISLQCKWSLISVILNIFSQSICISLHAHNMIPSDTLTLPYWSSLLTPTSATLWLHAAIYLLFLHSMYKDAWWTFRFYHTRVSFLTFFYKLIHTWLEWGWKQKDGTGLTCKRLKKNSDMTTDVSPYRLWTDTLLTL
jgi:hypothetical protein